MSIQILTQSSTLATMLHLEAKRRGFAAEGEPSVRFVDLDTDATPPCHDTIPTILLSADPTQADTSGWKNALGLLALPFSVTELDGLLSHRDADRKPEPFKLVGETLWLNGEQIILSGTEAALLELLYRHRARTVTEAELNAVLGESATRTNTLAVYLYRLRRKLCTDGVLRIRTERGKGYRWIEYEKR